MSSKPKEQTNGKLGEPAEAAKGNNPQTLAEYLKQLADSLQNRHWGYECTQDGHLITAYWIYPLKEGAYCSKTYYSLDGKLPADLLKRFDDWSFLEPLDTEEQKKLILFFTDGIWDMPLLADFLRTNCNATEPERLNWQNITKRLLWFAVNQGIKLDDIRQYPNLTFTMWQARADLASKKQNNQKAKSQTEKLSGKARALAVWTEHPEWSDIKIAKAAGISRTTLYDYPEFKNLRATQKEGKKRIRRGSKAKDGTIEAIDE